MRLIAACLLLLPFAATAGTDAVAESPAPDAATLTFADRVAACEAATHQGPHPFVPGFTIEHTLAGPREDGRCAYAQTMPGGMRMECAFDEAGRQGFAEEFREQAHGRMSGGTGEQDPWTRDCELVLPDGKRQPMAGG